MEFVSASFIKYLIKYTLTFENLPSFLSPYIILFHSDGGRE